MMPPLIAAALFLAAVCLSACGKSDPASPPPGQAQATPSPRPKDELDAGIDPLKKKTDGAIASVSNYLQEQSPLLKVKFEKAMEKFKRDKSKWRDKLRAKQKELQPQIERLKAQAAKVDSKTRDRLMQELARLQDESKDTDQKLTELEAAGKDAWHALKARMKEEEARRGAGGTPAADAKDEEDATPTPKPVR